LKQRAGGEISVLDQGAARAARRILGRIRERNGGAAGHITAAAWRKEATLMEAPIGDESAPGTRAASTKIRAESACPASRSACGDGISERSQGTILHLPQIA
jgi:hypothetical protein